MPNASRRSCVPLALALAFAPGGIAPGMIVRTYADQTLALCASGGIRPTSAQC
jgi:hypothetical protein